MATSSALGDTLSSPASLLAGQQLTYGNYSFAMQTDGNLVLYDAGKPIWASGTFGKGTNLRVAMQDDGNLVVYSPDGKALWASNTNRAPGTYKLILQADRNLVIYGPKSGSAYGPPIWSTNTKI